MRRNTTSASVKVVVTHILFGATCFYGGVLLGSHTAVGPSESACAKFRTLENVMASRIDRQAEEIDQLKQQLSEGSSEPRFPDKISAFAVGMGVVEREKFAERFDMGVPLDLPKKNNEQVLLMYGHEDTLPTFDEVVTRKVKSSSELPLMENLEQAVENCDTLNVVLTQPHERQCFAFMGQFKSYHIQKWMKLPAEGGGKLDHDLPLRLVNRGAQPSGRLSVKAPKKNETLGYWSTLSSYLQTLDYVLNQLKPIAEKAAHDNTVIVMVCNFGQAELLMNFVCASKAKGVDLSAVLVFGMCRDYSYYWFCLSCLFVVLENNDLMSFMHLYILSGRVTFLYSN